MFGVGLFSFFFFLFLFFPFFPFWLFFSPSSTDYRRRKGRTERNEDGAMNYEEFKKQIDRIQARVGILGVHTSPDFQCDQTDGFPTLLCWADGKAWLELNESLIHEGEDLSSYDRMCSDFGIRDCESIEDFNALLEELGDDAVQSATLYPEESEEYNLC